MPKHRINQFFTMRNREVGTKHVFAGGTRLVSKLVKAPNVVDLDGDGIPDDMPNACSEPWGWTNGNGGQGNANGICNGNAGGNGNGNGNSSPEVFEKDQYYYHPDHLGSSSYVTDLDGEIFQHLEYFPFGETWVEEHSNTQRTPYLFTAKELDEETGLYYFGARYYDPRTSVWQSPDPMLESFFVNEQHEGLAEPKYFSTFGYAWQNPVLLNDPDGRAPNKAGAGFASGVRVDLIVHRDRNSAGGTDVYQTLSNASQAYQGNDNRYFETEAYGWVDKRHFFRAAAESYNRGETITKILGFGLEVQQWLQEGEKDYQSAFSPEDIPSNAAGASFGAFVKDNPDMSMEDAFDAWLDKHGGGVDLFSSESSFDTLPATDPAYPKDTNIRGTSFLGSNDPQLTRNEAARYGKEGGASNQTSSAD